MSSGIDMTTTELSMRVMWLVCATAKQHPDFLLADLVETVVARYGVSRSTGYRLTRLAIDVLGVHYDAQKPARIARAYERRCDAQAHRLKPHTIRRRQAAAQGQHA